MPDNNKLSRGELLQRLAGAPLAIGALAALQSQAEAASKSPQASVKYVSHPVGGKKCDQCRFYIAAKTNPMKTNGACKIVAGSISPNGYCIAYSKK